MTYETAQSMMATVNPHYSLGESKHALLWKYASQVPPGAKILELGVCHGQTAVMLAYIAQSVGGTYCGVDDFSLEGDMETVFDAFARFDLNAVGIMPKKTQFAALLDWEPQDFILIDAGHDPVNVSHDCEKFVPLVKPGGIAAFDDYEDPYNPESAHWGVRHYADKATEGWERLDWKNGMLIAKRPL